MKSHNKLIGLFLEPPSNMTDSSFVMFYVLIGAMPGFLIYCASTLLMNIDQTDFQTHVPSMLAAVSALVLAPWIETLVFFAPIGIFCTALKGTWSWCKLISVALIFTAYHYLSGERTLFFAPFIFWAGLVMAFAYDVCLRTQRKSIILVALIHTAMNAITLLLQYIAYELAQTAFSFTIKMMALISVEVSFIIFFYWCICKILNTYQAQMTALTCKS